MTASSTHTLVVLPTYNEIDSLSEVVFRLLDSHLVFDLLIIDDASPDGTGTLADFLAKQHPRVTVAHRHAKLGLGTAYLFGFRHAISHGYHYVVEMDSDGSHLPEQLPSLLAAASAGAGLVMGTRWISGGRIQGWPRYRKWISRTGTGVAQIVLRSKLHDVTSGFRVIDTKWLARIDLGQVRSQGYGFQVELAWTLERLGCPIAEVPITFIERCTGRSKMSLRIVLEALGRVLIWGFLLRFAPDKLPSAQKK